MGDTGARKRAVFLDRDGVLVRALVRHRRPYSPRQRSDFEILPDAVSSCKLLKQAGFVLIVVTNQPDIARGDLGVEELSAMHEELIGRIPVDAVLVCPHDDRDACSCRKPAPGLLLEAARRWGLSLADSFMVGDRWKDVEAGRRAGCRTVFVDAGYHEPGPEQPDVTVTSLSDAVPWILTASGEDST